MKNEKTGVSQLRRWTGRLLGSILAVGFFVGGYYLLLNTPGQASQRGRTPADPEQVAAAAIALTVDGTLDTDEIDISSKVPGRLTNVFVKEGDAVKAGQVVAILEAEELDAKQQQATANERASEVQVTQGELAEDLELRKDGDQVAQAETGVRAAQATLGMARAKLTALENGARPQEIAQAQAGVQAAQANLGMATDRLSALKAGARPQEISQAEQAVVAAQSAFDTAKKTYVRIKNLADEGVVALQKADEAEMADHSTAAGLAAAKAKLDLVKAGPRQQEIDAAAEQVAQASAALDAARQTASLAKEGARAEEKEAARQQVRQAEMGVAAAWQTLRLAKDGRMMAQIRHKDVEAARQKVAASQGQMNEVQAYQRQTHLLSPITGRVTQRMSRAGEIVAPGYAVLSVACTDHYWVDVYVDESCFHGHHVGEQVQVQIVALGRALPGHIARLLPAADFATKRATNEKGSFDARSVQLRVTLDNTTLPELATGMTAHVIFNAK